MVAQSPFRRSTKGLRILDSIPFGAAILDEARIMPKQKTHKGTKKRFRLTANGKAKHRKAGTSHLAFRLTNKRRRNLRGTDAVAKPMEKKIRQALNGYSN